MNTGNLIRTGDLLYKVDPKKLSVKVIKINFPEDGMLQFTTTHENFSFEKQERNQISLLIDELPFEYEGGLCFLTEDEANIYIKNQIGM